MEYGYVRVMELKPSVLDLNLADVETRIKRFIRTYVENSGAKGIVLGMSGGIDSNTIAALSAGAIGGDKVLGLMLPEKETYNSKDIQDAQTVADAIWHSNASLRHHTRIGGCLQIHTNL